MARSARWVATQVVYRVYSDEAWASRVLDHECVTQRLSAQDAALATHIVYGTLRGVITIDRTIQKHLSRKQALDIWTQAALRTAVFQLWHMDRTPAHAIVHEAVELVREARGAQLGGFTNAVLRSISADAPEQRSALSTMGVAPWLRRAMIRSLGESRASKLLDVPIEAPTVNVRVRRDVDTDAFIAKLREAAPTATVERSPLTERGVRVAGAGDPRAWPGYDDGVFCVQEEGSQFIASAIEARANEHVADVCAGRGGKTMALLEVTPHVLALDLHEHRLAQIELEAQRCKLSTEALRIAAVDLSVGTGGYGAEFDRVLVDAPCTGVGTMRRRPEIALRLTADHVGELQKLQRAILRNASTLVRLGGVLVYAVCSPLHEEGRDVAAWFTDPARDAEGANNARFLPHPVAHEEVGPWLLNADRYADAYQVFRWVRVG